MSAEEYDDLRRKAEGACMTQSQLLRLLIAGYQPPPAPDDAFFEYMDRLLKMSGDLMVRSKEAESDDMARFLREEAYAVRNLRREIEERYLSGERRKSGWL